jgi:plastocyanin
MKMLVPLIFVVAAVAVAPGSTAATVQVAITSAGFVPANVTVNVGDTVTWRNADTQNRQVVSTQAGFASPVLGPTATFSFTFTRAGKFRVEEILVRPRIRGNITVRPAAAAGVTIAAQPKTVTYGRATALSGAVAPRRANEAVSILARRCRESAFTKIGEVRTTADGAWTFPTKPLDRTAYRAQWGSATNDAAVRVRPRITLVKLAPHRYRVRVRAAESFAGKTVAFQRWNATRRVWVRVRLVTLVDTGLGVAPTVISGRNFRSRISAGRRVRIAMGPIAAGPCYLGNRSGVIRS